MFIIRTLHVHSILTRFICLECEHVKTHLESIRFMHLIKHVGDGYEQVNITPLIKILTIFAHLETMSGILNFANYVKCIINTIVLKTF
jgi:hypothetical protein